MALTPIDVGSSENDGLGDKIRAAFQKVNLIVSQMWDTVTGGIAYLSGSVGIGIIPDLSAKLHILDELTTSGSASLLIQKTGIISATGYGAFVSVTGASSINMAGYFSATGASNNYGLIVANGYTGLGGITSPNSPLAVGGLPVYADNAAALAGGLSAGDFYHTSATAPTDLKITTAT